MTYIHINRPSSTRFIARVRRHGCRKYEIVSPAYRSSKRAAMAMMRAFTGGDYKRGDVIMTADYYDPIVVVEVTR